MSRIIFEIFQLLKGFWDWPRIGLEALEILFLSISDGEECAV